MEEILLKVFAVVAGVAFARFAFSQLLKKEKRKREFTSEYMDAVNNPEYKVKGSYN